MEAAVAREQEHAPVGMRYLRADCRAHTKAHGAHAAGGEQGLFRFDFGVLRHPHLVLSDVGRNDVAVGFEGVDRLDKLIRERIVGERLGRVVKMMLPLVDFGEPDMVLLLLHADKKRLNNQLGVAENVFVHLDVFVDFCFVDFELHNLCLLAKALAVTCHTVGEPRADGDNQVARSRHHAGFVAAVHADVADTQRMACRNTAQTHQRTADRRVNQLRKLPELLAGVRAENAAAGINHRAARFADKRLHTRDGIGIGDGVRLGRFGTERLKLGDHGGDVLGDVHQNRTLSAAAGKLERLADGRRQVLNFGDKGARLGDGL